MKRAIFLAAALLLACCSPPLQISAQNLSLPLSPGVAVVTCFAGTVDNFSNIAINPDDYVVGLIDIRTPPPNLIGKNWTPPMYHHPKWTARHLGQVFGLALDHKSNMYVCASATYGIPFTQPDVGLWGPGGPGAIYRLDQLTGEPTLFAQLPNSGAGLGNIAFDRTLLQFFVTNLEDGKIYRLDMDGNVLSNFDPFAPDDGRSGIVERGEWIWGIGVNDGRVFYARWNEDWRNRFFPEENELWSIGLDRTGEFVPSTNRKEFDIINFPWTKRENRSSGVADIAFAPDGRMLLAEVTFFRDIGVTEFFGRLLEYRSEGNGWSAAKTIYVGAPESGTNAQGGVDYGYDNTLPVSQGGCYGSIWATGNPLIEDNVANAGIAGIPAEGNTRLNAGETSFFVDVDGVLTKDEYLKSLMGDIEIWKECCVDGFVTDTIRASIGNYGPYTYNETVEIAVRLDSPLEDLEIETLALNISYEPLAMRPVGITPDSIKTSLYDGLLEDWKVSGVQDNGPGTISLSFTPPAGVKTLPDSGVLAWIRFETFLIIDPSSITDSIGKIVLPFSLTATGTECTAVETTPGTLQLELCGLQYRLIEASFSKYSLKAVANPAVDYGELDFSLGLDGPTLIELFDARGNRATTLLNEHLNPGQYKPTMGCFQPAFRTLCMSDAFRCLEPECVGPGDEVAKKATVDDHTKKGVRLLRTPFFILFLLRLTVSRIYPALMPITDPFTRCPQQLYPLPGQPLGPEQPLLAHHEFLHQTLWSPAFQSTHRLTPHQQGHH